MYLRYPTRGFLSTHSADALRYNFNTTDNIYEYSQRNLLYEKSLHSPLRHTISSLPFMATGVNGQETGFAHRHLPLPTNNEKQSMHLDQYPWQQRCASATRHTAKARFPHHYPYQCPSHRLTHKTRTQAALPTSSQRRHGSYTLFRTRPTI